MMSLVPDLLLRLDARWNDLSHMCYVCWVGCSALYTIVATKGGVKRVRRWVRELENERRDEAKSRISSGLDSIIKNINHDLGCNALLAGLDQWRECENRIRKHLEMIDRVPYWVLSGIGLCIVALIVRMIEPEHSTLSVFCGFLDIVSLVVFVWVLIAISPLLRNAYLHGYDAQTRSATPDVRPALQPLKLEDLSMDIRRISAKWDAEQTVFALKPLVKESRLKLAEFASSPFLPESRISVYSGLIERAKQLENTPMVTDEEWGAFRELGKQFFSDVFECIGCGETVETNIEPVKSAAAQVIIGEIYRVVTGGKSLVASMTRDLYKVMNREREFAIDVDVLVEMYAVNTTTEKHFLRDFIATVEIDGATVPLVRQKTFYAWEFDNRDYEYCLNVGGKNKFDRSGLEPLRPVFDSFPLELEAHKPIEGWVHFVIQGIDPEKLDNNRSYKFAFVNSLGKEIPVLKASTTQRAGEISVRQVVRG